ncbi:Acyltransferase family domain containing protein [Rhypophila sp. PSN 637]
MATIGGSGSIGSGSGTNKSRTTGTERVTTTSIRRLFTALLPSFITESAACVSSNANPGEQQRRRRQKLHATSSTAYLDGLRGLAACSVFAYHYTDYNHKFFLPIYGYNTEQNVASSSFMQLPYVRLLYSGTPMVHVFFVISGFALSLRPLGYLYPQDGTGNGDAITAAGQAKAQALLASSAFRRPVRLFIPPLGATAVAAFVVFVFGWMPTFMKPEETLWAQISDWAIDAVYRVMWPWNWDEGSPHSRYNPHLWTIPMEFVHSMFLFLVLLVLSRLRGPGTRLLVLGALMAYTLLIGRWAAFEFLGGAFLAELHLGTHSEATNLAMRLPGILDGALKTKKSSLRTLKKALQIMVLLVAGYILSWPPRKVDMTSTFNWIQELAPRSYGGGEKGKNFWLAVAAFGTVWAAGRIQFVKNWVLISSFAQYAGKISFCFYIFQHLILNLMQAHLLGREHKPATETREEEIGWGVRGVFGISSTLQRTVTWWVGLLIMGMALVCLADFGTRFLDAPAVRLAKRTEALAFGVSVPEHQQILLQDMGDRGEGGHERVQK